MLRLVQTTPYPELQAEGFRVMRTMASGAAAVCLITSVDAASGTLFVLIPSPLADANAYYRLSRFFCLCALERQLEHTVNDS